MLAGSTDKAGADVGQHGFAAALGLAQVHVELAVVHALGMLVELGAARAPPDRVHLGHLCNDLLREPADAVGLGQADARLQNDADQHGAFVERRQERARQQRARIGGAENREDRQPDDEGRSREAPFEAAPLPALEGADEHAFVLAEMAHARQSQ